MFRSVVFKRAVVGLLMLSLLSMVACQSERSPGIDTATAPPPPAPDIVDDDDSTKGYMYKSGNPYHDTKMHELLRRPDVSATVASFEARDFDLSRANSFSLEGLNEDLGISATFIAMTGVGENAFQSATITCFSAGDEFGITSAVFSTNPSRRDPGWRPLCDGVWIRDTTPTTIDFSAQKFLDWWSWDYFSHCMMSRVPAAAGGCAISCITIPGYWQCFLVCVAAESLGATVGCLIAMYVSRGKEMQGK